MFLVETVTEAELARRFFLAASEALLTNCRARQFTTLTGRDSRLRSDDVDRCKAHQYGGHEYRVSHSTGPTIDRQLASCPQPLTSR